MSPRAIGGAAQEVTSARLPQVLARRRRLRNVGMRLLSEGSGPPAEGPCQRPRASVGQLSMDAAEPLPDPSNGWEAAATTSLPTQRHRASASPRCERGPTHCRLAPPSTLPVGRAARARRSSPMAASRSMRSMRHRAWHVLTRRAFRVRTSRRPKHRATSQQVLRRLVGVGPALLAHGRSTLAAQHEDEGQNHYCDTVKVKA